jgi:hypothetical protein
MEQSPNHALQPTHAYEVRPRKDRRGVDLISDALPFGRLWYTEIPHAIGYTEFYSRSHRRNEKDDARAADIAAYEKVHEQILSMADMLRGDDRCRIIFFQFPLNSFSYLRGSTVTVQVL